MLRQQRRGPHYPRVQDSVPKSKTGMDKFSTSLDTFQQVLGVIHSSAPYIEKYGPVVQKLPTMYRMYRAMKDIDGPKNEKERESRSEIEGKNEMESSLSKVDREPLPDRNESFVGKYPSPTLYI